MIIQLMPQLSEAGRQRLKERIEQYALRVTEVHTQQAGYLVCLGKEQADIRFFGAMEGVADVYAVTDSYQLVSRKWKMQTSVIDLDGIRIGDGGCTVMAGPCAIESEAQVRATVQHLADNGIRIMRGGIFKPRSSPYTFRGMGIEGLKLFYRICREHDIRIISEVMEVGQVEQMYDYVDIFQVGARNAQNFNLLDALGRTDKPVLIKRGISGTIDELLYAAEYVFSGGNEQLMLCERGIRTYEHAYRNTFDINAIPLLKEKTHLPVIADPSHGIGLREHVPAIALAAVAAGADGLIYEVQADPETAVSDGRQTIDFETSSALTKRVAALAALLRHGAV